MMARAVAVPEALLVVVVAVGVLVAEAALPRPDPLRPHILSLDGAGWTLSNKARGIVVGGAVPGGVYSDLRAAGQLPQDLFYRFNDVEYRWVGNENWTYERSFQVPREALSRDKQVLVLHGVDTVADVLLNGQLLGGVDNMFVRHRFDVKGVLEDGHNHLEVRFASPVGEAARRAAEQDKQYPVPPACPPSAYHGECSVNHLRKMQASFAWDWGPAFPSMGLWKSVHLETYDEAVLRDLGFRAWPSSASWRALVRVYWERGAAAAPLQGPAERASAGRLELTLAAPDGTVILYKDTPVTLVADKEGAGHTDVPISVPNDLVQLWWPSGYGLQPLYRLSVSLRTHGLRPGRPDVDAGGPGQDQLSVKVGFRNISLVQEEVRPGDPSKGLSFYFVVNGVPVFAKGSNWVPAHVLPELGADPDVVGHLLHSAKEANMNMIRVWGGGVYESDLFYQLADELGILVWQDMMFACAMYPVGAAFLRSVEREARQQYRRLHHHASVALWAGNNENEAALRGNWYGTAGRRFDAYRRDYVTLYVDTVRAALRDEGAKANFVVSSPSNMAESEREGFVARNPYSSLYGDDHHYDYLSDAWNPAVFHHTRFGSEYGFMSWPSRATMLGATDREHADEDLALGGRLADHRQHHPGGNQEMALQIRQHMQLPDDYKDAKHYDEFAYKSQIYQALATKTETEFYRRSRNLLTPGGEGRTMGALYWMLNDVWQAPSWSSIEFNGNWKMLHAVAQQFLAPLLVSPSLDGDVLNVDVVSDEDRHDELLVHTEVMAWGSFSPPRAQRVTAVRLSGAGSTPRAWSGPLAALLAEAGCGAPGSCLIKTRLTSLDNATVLSENALPIGPLTVGVGRLPVANVQISGVEGPLAGSQRQPWDFVVRVTASAPAAFVWLDAGPLRGRFSRNAFHLLEAGPVEVRFLSRDHVSLARFGRHISVRSL